MRVSIRSPLENMGRGYICEWEMSVCVFMSVKLVCVKKKDEGKEMLRRTEKIVKAKAKS